MTEALTQFSDLDPAWGYALGAVTTLLAVLLGRFWRKAKKGE